MPEPIIEKDPNRYKYHCSLVKTRMDGCILQLMKFLNRFQWLETRHPIRGWIDFKSDLLCRCHDPQQWNCYEVLMALKEDTTVSDYKARFELYSAPLMESP